MSEALPVTGALPALREALGHNGYLLLCSGYLVCGFQLMFISVHFPAFLIDQRMTPETGMTALALIGLFNVFGSYLWGWLGNRYTKKYVLSALYFTRAVVIAIFISLPVSPITVYLFGAAIGFLWLGTVPVTNGLTVPTSSERPGGLPAVRQVVGAHRAERGRVAVPALVRARVPG